MIQLNKKNKIILFFKNVLFNFLTILENILFLNKGNKLSTSNELITHGWKNLNTNFKDLLPIDVEKIQNHSPYSSLLIVNEENIKVIINKILNKSNIMQEIENSTGMKYSIDFFLHWEIRNIPEDLSKKQYFANLWHRDTFFTRNVIKLFILTHDTSADNGPITWINKVDTDNILKNNYNEFNEDLYESKKNIFTGNEGQACLINPNVCLHKASNPKEGHHRRLIMLQLNPSRKISYKNDLYDRQFKLEPNIPFIRNLFRKSAK